MRRKPAISIQGTVRTLSGRGRYADGKLWIDVKDEGGDFSICLDEARVEWRDGS